MEKFTIKQTIRAILSMGVVGTTCYLAIENKISMSTFVVMATAIIIFYFKKDEEDDKK